MWFTPFLLFLQHESPLAAIEVPPAPVSAANTLPHVIKERGPYVITFLIKHLYLNGIWHQRDICYNEIRLCAQYTLTILGSIENTIWEGLCNHFEKWRIITLTSYNLCISTPILKHEMTICVIHSCYPDETIPNLIQWSKMSLELEEPTYHTIHHPKILTVNRVTWLNSP